MLLTITDTHPPATDLGYLLHKHPERLHTFELSFGQAHVFYPEAREDRCTAALLLDVDPVGLVRGKAGARDGGTLDQYVNDRPYVASSLLSVALGRAFSTALSGRSAERPERAAATLPFETMLSAVPCRGGADFLRALFEPLGYEVEADAHPLDERFPEWGMSPYFTVRLRGTVRLRDLLAHLYVLIPVLDEEKHYWVGEDEVEKLLRRGEGWLTEHPLRDEITHRYLRRQWRLTRLALDRLAEDRPDPDRVEEARDREEESLERPLRLDEQRHDAVARALIASGARRVIDLGCGEGKLLERLIREPQIEALAGMDVSMRALGRARDRLDALNLPLHARDRVTLFQGSLMYRDARIAGYDGAAVIEVIEHLDPPRLAAFERILFEQARPATVALTTPNREYNALFPSLPAGTFRHGDHRFEWTRSELVAWAEAVAKRYGYTVRYEAIGPEHPDYGPPTQMAVFTRTRSEKNPNARGSKQAHG